MSSHLLTQEVGQLAIEISMAAFQKAYELGNAGGSSVHIAVMDPTKSPQNHEFRQAILCEASFGNANDYILVARSKAEISWRYKMYSQEVQQFYPHLHTAGMTKWGGGVYLHHIPVGVSGVQYQMDQWLAEVVAVTCRALCITDMRAIVDGPNSFVGVDFEA